MSTITRFKKNNKCPICSDSTGKCGQNQEGLVFCMTNAGSPSGTEVAGYRYVGDSKNGAWGLFIEKDAKSQRSWTHRPVARTDPAKKRKELEEQERRRLCVSEEERHHAYTDILSQLTLHQDDRLELQFRGFSEDQINSLGFKSVGQWQKVRETQEYKKGKYPSGLPGLNSRNTLLSNSPGYLCPVRDLQGRIIGCQVRRRNPKEDEGRYYWLSSNRSVQLINGENPIGVWLPFSVERKEENGVWLVEGTGAKPALAAEKHEVAVIGAAGGLFTASPFQLRQYLKELVKEGTQVYLPLDGGDVVNRHVRIRIEKLIKFLLEENYEPVFVWWGQFTKESPDVDELTNEELAFLSPAELEALCPDFNFEGLPEPEPPKEHKEEATSKAFSSLDIEPDSEEYRLYQQRRDEEAFVAEAESEYLQQQWEQAGKNARKVAWVRCHQFTPTHTLNREFFDWEIPPEGSVLAIKSPLGSGKTTWLGRLIEELKDEAFVVAGYRNGLLRHLQSRWNALLPQGSQFYHIHFDSAFSLTRDPHGKILSCVDSLKRFRPEDFEGKNVIIDEVCSVVLHLLFSGGFRGQGRRRILDLFSALIKNSKRVIILDGRLTNLVCDYIAELRGISSSDIVRVENVFTPPSCTFKSLELTRTDKGGKNKLDISPLVADSIEKLEAGKNIIIHTDGKEKGKILETLFSSSGYFGLRVDSETIEDAVTQAFLDDPDRWIKENQPRFITLSPTAESGIDISIKNYFESQYTLIHHLGPDAAIQFIFRLRDSSVERFLWVNPFLKSSNEEGFKSAFHRQILRCSIDYLVADAEAMLMQGDRGEAIRALAQALSSIKEDAHTNLWSVLLAKSNYEKQNLRVCLYEELQRGGHLIQEFSEDRDDIADAIKGIRENIRIADSIRRFNSKDITVEQANQILSRHNASLEERDQAAKAKLKERLPGVEKTKIWSPDLFRLVHFEDKTLLPQLELRWLLFHPEETLQLQRKRWKPLVHKPEYGYFLGDHKSQLLMVKAFRHLNVQALIEAGRNDFVLSAEHPLVLTAFAKGKGKNVRTALQMAPGKAGPMSYIQRLLKKLGYGLVSKRQRQADGSVIRLYRIDPVSLSGDGGIREEITKCLQRRWGEMANIHFEYPQENRGKISSSQQPQTPASPAVKPDPLLDNIYKTTPTVDQPVPDIYADCPFLDIV